MRILLLLITISLLSCNNEAKKDLKSTKTIPTPDQIFPELFEDVQLSHIFPDSKTFVDCSPKHSAESINSFYKKEKKIPDFDLKKFVDIHFIVPGSISSNFRSDSTKSASEHVNSLWPILTRPADVVKEGSSLIPLPKEYIVPGGRFREVYYWDSYFTMLGLIEDGKIELAESINDNFAHLIATIGHIPNGNRTYYHTRSQPPFFSQMVKLLAEVKGQEIYLKYHQALKAEYAFWMNNSIEKTDFEHCVNTEFGVLNRYYDQGVTPRQESYIEDLELVEKNKGGEKMYRDLRSGAESGWDYSSRWLSDGENLSTIQTTDIIPIDLNALLYGLEEILLSLEKDGKTEFALKLKKSMKTRKQFIKSQCWNSDGTYEDFNWVTKQQCGKKTLAMMYPLYFNMVDQKEADLVADYIKTHFLKGGGVITSLHQTGQQWDAPNGWAPLQWITVKALQNYSHDDLANTIASRWVELNEKVYHSTGKFVEKYNVEDLSLEAGGGEYPVQDGFGWSNGVYLALKNQLNN